MTSKLLANLEFNNIIGESTAQTATGSNLLNKYKSHLMANESTCRLVNNFVSEASQCSYDNGVYNTLEPVSDYIQSNKTSWALASVCENLRRGKTSWNYLNQSAIDQVEKLLENDEDTVNKYIKAGALKNVMYVTEFRNIAKQVYHDMPMIESTAEYKMVRPISFVEDCGDGYMFEAAGKLFQISSDKNISEAQWNEVSNTFRQITSLLESNICTFDEVSETLSIDYQKITYEISECGKVKRNGIEMTTEQLRENNNLYMRTINRRYANEVAQVLESIALTCENFNNIVKMDNVGIFETNSDKFLVINEGMNMYTTLLRSNHRTPWTYNCNVVEALENIKANTRVSLSERYNEQVRMFIENTSEEDKKEFQKKLNESKKLSTRERIEALTEKFKNDPVKLAVLSQVAQDLQNVEMD
jgi:hypothetical protein